LSPVVKPDESSRALPNPATADQYQEVYTRFKGLTQRLASGGYL
jgi:hypothetical protein